MGNIGPSRQRYDVLPAERDPQWERELAARLADDRSVADEQRPPDDRHPAADQRRG